MRAAGGAVVAHRLAGPQAPEQRKRLAVLRRDIFVAETDAAAHAEVCRVLAEGYRGTGRAEVLVGSPAAVVERLSHCRRMGFEEVMVHATSPGTTSGRCAPSR